MALNVKQMWSAVPSSGGCCYGDTLTALAEQKSPKLIVLYLVNGNILKTLNYEVTAFHFADMQLTLHLLS